MHADSPSSTSLRARGGWSEPALGRHSNSEQTLSWVTFTTARASYTTCTSGPCSGPVARCYWGTSSAEPNTLPCAVSKLMKDEATHKGHMPKLLATRWTWSTGRGGQACWLTWATLKTRATKQVNVKATTGGLTTRSRSAVRSTET